MNLATCIHQFFNKYLPHIKGLSNETIKAYRDVFRLFLRFAAKHQGIKIESLRLDHLSPELILDFLDDLEANRKNTAKTRNQRLAAIKSLAKMIRFMCPDKRRLAEKILNIPQKRTQKQLIGFLYPQEVFKVFASVDLNRKVGLRDYALLHLLYDSGARASEITTLNLDYFNPEQRTLAILGKGNQYRLIELLPKTVQLLELYIARYRITPKPRYKQRIFINQWRKELTRHGIYQMCKKYLSIALPAKRLKGINPVHSFRHSCAVKMLASGHSVSEIRNHLGHESLESTMVYLHLDLSRKRQIQEQFMAHAHSVLTTDSKIDELFDGESKQDIMTWLDSL
jgi:site-specific recombinase XerD